MAENSKTSLGVITQIVGAVLETCLRLMKQSTSNDRMGISL